MDVVIGRSFRQEDPNSLVSFCQKGERSLFASLCRNDKKTYPEIREDMVSFGEELFGYPFNICLDMEHCGKRLTVFTPSSGKTIVKFPFDDCFRPYKDKLSLEAGKSLAFIVGSIATQESSIARDGQYTVYTLPYSEKALRAAFDTLWKDDLLLDSRCGLALRLFNAGEEKIEDLKIHKEFHYRDKEEDFEKSVAWMARPDNADRIAHAYLFRQFSQHFQGMNPHALRIACGVADRIDEGQMGEVLDILQKSPQTLCAEMTGALPSEHRFARACNLYARDPENEDVTEASGLAEKARKIVMNYKRLRDGTWAQNVLG